MNIIKESTSLNGANEQKFLENSMLNLLAANQFGNLMTYVIETVGDQAMESKLLASLLNDAQQSELY
jgi:hypothetical protein